jgi:CelD/BcsL family acetyltransferase involved in cellulose biosynthesis
VRVEVVLAEELTEQLMARWRQIQQADATLTSPYFCPEFVWAVGQVFPNTFVGVIEEAGEVVGFLPFERYSERAGQGVANSKADYQGVIIDSKVEWDAGEVLRGCRLASLEFSHLLASQRPLQRYHKQVVKSHVLNLRAGAKEYRKDFGDRQLGRKLRQAAREVGPLRFEVENHCPAVLSRLVELKREQYARTRALDGLAGGMPQVLEVLHAVRSPTFRAVLSVLYIGDAILAVHFGMRSQDILHWWYPAYEPQFAKYSPGLLLLKSLVDASGGVGFWAIDLGYGDEPYKLQIANESVLVAHAVVGASWQASLRQYKQAMGQYKQAIKQYVTGTRLEGPARAGRDR